MEPLFNEYGTACKRVEDVSNEVERIVRRLLEQLIVDGYSGADIRAVGCDIMQSVSLEVSMAMLERANFVQQKIRAATDMNLSKDEIEEVLKGNKIQAIKLYRHRTTVGLKESKDAVEKWMEENKERIQLKKALKPEREGFATDPVHEEGGFWYFWDETWASRHGPFSTKENAEKELAAYCRYLEEGRRDF